MRNAPKSYLGGNGIRGLHNLIEHILILSLAEFRAKRCTHVSVTLAADNEVTVEHNGRSFPISDKGQKPGTLTLERALTELPAWGFRQGDSWLALVTAFSIQLTAEVQYFGKRYRQSFIQGVPDAPAKTLGPTSSQGLKITFTLDPTLLHGEYQYDVLESRLRELAYLNPGLDFVLSDERPVVAGSNTWCFLMGSLLSHTI